MLIDLDLFVFQVSQFLSVEEQFDILVLVSLNNYLIIYFDKWQVKFADFCKAMF